MVSYGSGLLAESKRTPSIGMSLAAEMISQIHFHDSGPGTRCGLSVRKRSLDFLGPRGQAPSMPVEDLLHDPMDVRI